MSADPVDEKSSAALKERAVDDNVIVSARLRHARRMQLEQARKDDLVRRALTLIDPKAPARRDCRSDVERADVNIRLAILQGYHASVRRTKEAKKAAHRLATALRNVEGRYSDILKHFPVRGFPRQELWKFRLGFERMANTPSGKLPRAGAEEKRLAVAAAHNLMRKYGARITATQGSKFCRLAALMYRKPTADLHTQCKAHIRALRKGAKSVSK
jgi:hypothetical protein